MKLKERITAVFDTAVAWVAEYPRLATGIFIALPIVLIVLLSGCALPTVPQEVMDRSDKCYALTELAEKRRMQQRNVITDPKDAMLEAITALKEVKQGVHTCDAVVTNWIAAAKEVTVGNQRLAGQGLQIGGVIGGIYAVGDVVQGISATGGTTIKASDNSTVNSTVETATFRGGDNSSLGGFHTAPPAETVVVPQQVVEPTVVEVPVPPPAP
jgi:hypothetical protein